jgi:ribonuclease BN (tRNA processing enzyme)
MTIKMKLTVLGNNGPFPAAGGACSGYLISEGNIKILIDCGSGVLSNLLKFVRFEELDAIILTHLHSDHISDMMVLRYAVQIKKARGFMDKCITVYAPNDPEEEFKRLDIKGVFDLKPITGNLQLSFDNLKITFKDMKHPVKCFGISIYDGSVRFVFSGDTSICGNIIEFSRNADLVMLDSGLLERDKKGENVPHLTAKECGLVAKEAGAKKLLLTHFWPDYNIDELLAEAKENFENVEASKLLISYEI